MLGPKMDCCHSTIRHVGYKKEKLHSTLDGPVVCSWGRKERTESVDMREVLEEERAQLAREEEEREIAEAEVPPQS